jgi:hypothetical protein
VFFDPDCPEQLFECMLSLANDATLWSALSARAKNNVLRYSWEKAGSELTAFVLKTHMAPEIVAA